MKNVISLAVLCCVITIATAAMTEAERAAEERQWFADCKDEEGATQEDIDNILNRIVPTKQNAKCVLACVHELIGMANNGKLQVGTLRKLVARRHEGDEKKIAEIYEMIDECRVLQYPRQRCEFSAAYMQCTNDAYIRRGIDLLELSASANRTNIIPENSLFTRASTPAKKKEITSENKSGSSFEEARYKLHKSFAPSYSNNVIQFPLSQSSTGLNTAIQSSSYRFQSAIQPSSYGFYSAVRHSAR